MRKRSRGLRGLRVTLSGVSSVLCTLAPGGTTRRALARAVREHADWHFHRSKTRSNATFSSIGRLRFAFRTFFVLVRSMFSPGWAGACFVVERLFSRGFHPRSRGYRGCVYFCACTLASWEHAASPKNCEQGWRYQFRIKPFQ